jgi:pilus assembly protein CpaB
MKRRIIAAVAAVLLAAVGAVGIYAYIHAADQRAMAGQEPVKVLVVTKPIPKGTTPIEMAPLVTSKILPRAAVVPGAVDSLSGVGEGNVVTTDLQPGEQVLSSRFADPATLVSANSVPVPKGLQEVSVQLDAQRALGGNIVPGDKAGIFLSIKVDKKDANGEETKDDMTHLVFHKVLVSKVQGGLAPLPKTAENANQTAAMPEERSLMVTLAVTAPQAEKIVFTAESGTIWLSNETPDDGEKGTKIITEEGLYR